MKIVDDFETKIKEFTGAKYALALNSGTAAIHLALKALGVGPGDCVIAPSFTYVATINPILYLGAIPILIDCEPITWNIDPDLLESAIKDRLNEGQKPRCVIVVHGYGMPARMNEVTKICLRYNIPVLEDAAEAIGSSHQGAIAGTLGEVGIFSFNNNKTITTYGGGVLITANEEIYNKTLFWANQSRENKPFYEHSDIGFNYRMGPLNAAAGLLGIRDLRVKVLERRQIFEEYKKTLKSRGVQVKWLEEMPGYYSNRWLSTVLLDTLDINNIDSKMKDAGIECRRLWNPMHLQPYFTRFPSYVNGLSEKLFLEGLCLPSCSLDEVPLVSDALFSASR